MRRKANRANVERPHREAPSQADIERQQRAMGRLWWVFRGVIGALGVCALGAAWIAFNS